jgi:putative peptidoglycan lipid II flippase
VSKSLKHIGVISFLTVVSRVLGMVRDALALAIFGSTWLTDAFYTAFSLPNLFRRLLAEGSLTAAFIPNLQEELLLRRREGAFSLLSQVVSWLAVVTGGLVAAAMLGFGHSRLLPGHELKFYVAADLTVLLFPYLFLISLAAAFNATLNVLEHFTEPALSPIWLNLAMIASLGGAGLHYATNPLGEIHWLCAGVLVGGFFQMAVPAAVLIREGWRPRFDLALSPRVVEIGRLMAPGLFGTAIYQINILVSRLLAFSLKDAGVTNLFTMNRLMELPIGVFAVAVSTVVYPLIARHAAQGKWSDMGADFRKGLRLILVLNIPAAVGLALLSRPIVRLIYEHGHVTPGAAGEMADLLVLFTLGMPFFSVVNLIVRGFYAVKDTRTPVRIAVIDFVLNVVLSLLLMRLLGVRGLVLASTTAIVVQTALLGRALVRRLPGMSFAALMPSVMKVLAGAALMAGFVLAGIRLIASLGLAQRAADLIAVAALIPIAVAVYGASLWLLRIEGWPDLMAVLTRLRPGRR